MLAISSLLASSLLLSPVVRPVRPVLQRLASAPRMSVEGTLEIVDDADDRLRFSLADGDLQLFVDDELFCPSVQNIEYESISGRVVTQGVTGSERGEFVFQSEQQAVQAVSLQSLAKRSTMCAWREVAEFQLPGDEVTLPPEVEALLAKEAACVPLLSMLDTCDVTVAATATTLLLRVPPSPPL